MSTTDQTAFAFAADPSATRARLWAQLAFVADNDAAALRCELIYPPVSPSKADCIEARRLTTVANKLFRQARKLGFDGGTDAAFG